MRVAMACGKPRGVVAALGVVLLIAACGSSSKAPAGAKASQGIAFASCMRRHGLSDFPDPIPGHGLQFNLPAGVAPGSPAFRSAQASCKHLVPQPGRGNAAESAGADSAALAFARCMRAHGVPSYPDPAYRNGRPTEQPLSSYGIGPDAPAVQGAERACQGN
jgi:hypothetical protein